jgi:hypothetical protein
MGKRALVVGVTGIVGTRAPNVRVGHTDPGGWVWTQRRATSALGPDPAYGVPLPWQPYATRSLGALESAELTIP